jgi:large subunit ribosomal protein L29
MKNSEIKDLSKKELDEKIQEERANLVHLKLNHTVSPLENPLKIKYSRRMIARLVTEYNSRKQKNEQ